MEHESDDDVLIIDDESDNEITVEFQREPDTEDLFKRIDEVLADEPETTRSRPAILSQPAIQSSGLKRVHIPVQAPDRGMPSIVPGSITPAAIVTSIAGTSGLSEIFLNRLGPAVLPLASRLGPPSTSSTRSSTPTEELKVKRPRGPDRRPEQYRELTQKGLATLNLPEFVRPAVNRPFYTAYNYNRNELLWRELTHKDRTAREHSEWNLHLQTPRQMVKISYQTARRLIKETYRVEINHKLNVHEFYEGQAVADTDVRIVAFEQEVRECGFMSFDTEGGGNLPSKDKFKESKRVFVAMSSPKTGRVLLFHCLNDVPKILLKLLSDYAIAKIQSNIAADVKILDDAGYDVRGLVDSGVLYTFIVPGCSSSPNCGQKQDVHHLQLQEVGG